MLNYIHKKITKKAKNFAKNHHPKIPPTPTKQPFMQKIRIIIQNTVCRCG